MQNTNNLTISQGQQLWRVLHAAQGHCKVSMWRLWMWRLAAGVQGIKNNDNKNKANTNNKSGKQKPPQILKLCQKGPGLQKNNKTKNWNK